MAIQYKAGETKVRPGNYERYSAAGQTTDTSARDGICAMQIKATWGPVGAVVALTKSGQLKEQFGNDAYDKAKSTVEAAAAMFSAGAKTVYVVRMGAGGEKGSLVLKNSDDTAVAKATAKYPGTMPVSISIQEKLGDATKKVFTVYSGTAEKESVEFDVGENEPSNLSAAVKDSAYVEVTVEADGKGGLALVQAADGSLAGGSDPTVTTDSYSKAWELLEPYPYNSIALDVNDDESMTLSLLLKEYLDAAYVNGKKAVAAVGEPISVPLATRFEHAKAFNDEKIVYFGSGYVDAAGKTVDGALAICRVAGVIAATPSNEAITHLALPGAVRVAESLTNAQYEEAILNGALMLSASPSGAVWFDSGINTLTILGEDQDEGWKKIRRVKTRFETFDRIDRAISPRTGRINCDNDGIAEIIQTAKAVLDDMVTEGKYNEGVTFVQDTDTEATSDSAWFVIKGTDTEGAVDLDSLEKTYLHYLFQNSLTK